MEDYIPIWLEAKTTREFWMASPEPEEVRVIVTPESGTVPSGGNVVIQVRFDTNLLAEIEDFRGDDLGGKLVVQDRNVRGTEVEIDINVNMTGWDSTKAATAAKAGDAGHIAAVPLNSVPSHHDHIDRVGEDRCHVSGIYVPVEAPLCASRLSRPLVACMS